MLSFLRRKSQRYPTEAAWSVLEAKLDGKPFFVRRNESAKQLLGHADYGYRVGVAVPLLAGDANGLPCEEEMESLNQIEDALSAAFEDKQDSLQVLAVTTNSMREFVYYTRVPSKIEARLEGVRRQFPAYELQLDIVKDPKWQGFAEFA